MIPFSLRFAVAVMVWCPTTPALPDTATPVVPAASLAPGRTFRDCPQCPEMVVVPAGTFVMGDGDRQTARLGPQHRVRIARPFAVGRFEVTYGQWNACVADGRCPDDTWPLRPSGAARLNRDSPLLHRVPVTMVNWRDAKTYVAWLSRSTGKPYRLLSEAEWEYAARAGTTTRWFCGDDPSCLDGVAWYRANSRKRTLLVGSKRANAFGLYDVHGSLWEWVEDCWHPDYRGAPSDGSARTTGTTDETCDADHVLRGGSWDSTAWTLRIANRFGEYHTTSIFGIRVARDLSFHSSSRTVVGEHVTAVLHQVRRSGWATPNL